MDYENEYEAFKAYANVYPDNCLLLVDTYDTVHSGIPNAIRVFKELREAGHEPVGIRLDSGDFAYLSKKARKMLDEAGFPDTIICARAISTNIRFLRFCNRARKLTVGAWEQN